VKQLTLTGIAALATLGVGVLPACSDEAAPPLPTTSSSLSGNDDTAPGTDGSSDESTVATTTLPTTTLPTTTAPPTTTLPPLVTDGAEVLVANATNVPGAAGRFTQALSRVGYTTNPATDAAGWEIKLDTSKIYYLPDAKRAARSLARRMGVEIYPMPVPVPIVGAYEFFGDTTVVVMLGKDLADQPIPGIVP
jgi:hypothetical protein